MSALSCTPVPVSIPQGKLTLFERVYAPDDSARLFDRLNSEIDWRQETLFIYGRYIDTPRLAAWYGDAAYTYSGLKHEPRAWTPLLNELRNRVQELARTSFNSVLLNLYRDGRDSMSWHSDDEPELGTNPTIASLSLGGTRRFRFRKKTDASETRSLELEDASLLVMAGALQHHWQHALPKTKRQVRPRINLTFRQIAGCD